MNPRLLLDVEHPGPDIVRQGLQSRDRVAADGSHAHPDESTSRGKATPGWSITSAMRGETRVRIVAAAMSRVRSGNSAPSHPRVSLQTQSSRDRSSHLGDSAMKKSMQALIGVIATVTFALASGAASRRMPRNWAGTRRARWHRCMPRCRQPRRWDRTLARFWCSRRSPRRGLGVGGQLGDGALIKGGKVVGYYNTAGASVGLQAGAQTFGYAMFFMTDAGFAGARQGGRVRSGCRSERRRDGRGARPRRPRPRR